MSDVPAFCSRTSSSQQHMSTKDLSFAASTRALSSHTKCGSKSLRAERSLMVEKPISITTPQSRKHTIKISKYLRCRFATLCSAGCCSLLLCIDCRRDLFGKLTATIITQEREQLQQRAAPSRLRLDSSGTFSAAPYAFFPEHSSPRKPCGLR